MSQKKNSRLKSDDYIRIEEKTKKEKNDEIKEYKQEETKETPIKNAEFIKKNYRHPVIHSSLVMALLVSLIYFLVNLFYSNNYSVANLISSLLLIIFTLLFVTTSIKNNRKNKTGIFIGSIILCIYFIFGIFANIGNINSTTLGNSISNFAGARVINFTNMELTDVIKWSEEYKIDIVQDYEYSDMIPEYHIINQSVEAGEKLNNLTSIKVAVSEGPNPTKEVVVPNMVTWESERVLEFIKNNYLSNVEVEFVQSNKQADTVIEQSKSGNIKRNEELKLTFSYGEELGFEEIKLKDLTNMSKFEATFYLKQHQLRYEFKEVFSSKIKKGYVVSQETKAGTMVKINDGKIVINISKGPEIKVPNLKGMSMTEITEWVIKNKLKLKFTDNYDDSIDENNVISANYKKGEIVAEGTVIEIVVSRGKLIMPKFDSYNDFRDWAEKYNVRYEEKREFSDSVAAGDAISYSYKAGDTIKNDDSIVVTVSNGKEASVPNVVGNSKSDATSKLKNAGFGCSFVYNYSSSVAKGKVIRQSISAGSKVAQGTTITVTISNGPKPAGSTGGGGYTPPTPVTPVCDKSQGITVWIVPELISSDPGTTCSKIKGAYPKIKFSCQYVSSGPGKGLLVNSGSVDGKFHNYCDTYVLQIQN